MWTDLIKNILGEYVPLTALDGTPLTGIASINFTWISNTIIFIGAIFMVFKIINSLVNRIGR